MELNRTNRALTLMELIMATFVVGIIMAGVISADFAMRRMEIQTAQGTSAAMTAQVMLSHIMGNAYQAVGDVDPGIRIGDLPGNKGTGNAGSLCIRTDPSPSWACYSLIGSNPATLYTCVKSTARACANTDKALGKINVSGANGAKVLDPAAGLYAVFTTNSTPGSQQMTLSVTVRAYAQDTSATTVSSDTDYKVLTATISPPNYRI